MTFDRISCFFWGGISACLLVLGILKGIDYFDSKQGIQPGDIIQNSETHELGVVIQVGFNELWFDVHRINVEQWTQKVNEPKIQKVY